MEAVSEIELVCSGLKGMISDRSGFPERTRDPVSPV